MEKFLYRLFFVSLCCANVVQITKRKNANQLINNQLSSLKVLGAGRLD